jgi:hypothetical protein
MAAIGRAMLPHCGVALQHLGTASVLKVGRQFPVLRRKRSACWSLGGEA